MKLKRYQAQIITEDVYKARIKYSTEYANLFIETNISPLIFKSAARGNYTGVYKFNAGDVYKDDYGDYIIINDYLTSRRRRRKLGFKEGINTIYVNDIIAGLKELGYGVVPGYKYGSTKDKHAIKYFNALYISWEPLKKSYWFFIKNML